MPASPACPPPPDSSLARPALLCPSSSSARAPSPSGGHLCPDPARTSGSSRVHARRQRPYCKAPPTSSPASTSTPGPGLLLLLLSSPPARSEDRRCWLHTQIRPVRSVFSYLKFWISSCTFLCMLQII
jgi:hypothetical protein